MLAPDGPCTSPYTANLSGAPDATYTLTVLAHDTAGHTSQPATATYTLQTAPRRGPRT